MTQSTSQLGPPVSGSAGPIRQRQVSLAGVGTGLTPATKPTVAWPRNSSENVLRPPFCAREVAFERGERGASRGANGWPREGLKRRRHAARRTPEFGHLRQRRQWARGGELEARAAPGRRPEHVVVLARPWQRLQRQRLAARRSSARPSMAMAVTGAEKSGRRRGEEWSSPCG